MGYYDDQLAQIEKEKKEQETRLLAINGQIQDVHKLDVPEDQKLDKMADLVSQRNAVQNRIEVLTDQEKAIQAARDVAEIPVLTDSGGKYVNPMEQPANVEVKIENQPPTGPTPLDSQEQQKIAIAEQDEANRKAFAEEQARQAGEHANDLLNARFQNDLDKTPPPTQSEMRIEAPGPHHVENPLQAADTVTATLMTMGTLLSLEMERAKMAEEGKQRAAAEAAEKAAQEAAKEKAQEAAKQDMSEQLKEQRAKAEPVPQLEQTAKEMEERKKFEDWTKQREADFMERNKDKSESERAALVDKFTETMNKVREEKEREWERAREVEERRREEEARRKAEQDRER